MSSTGYKYVYTNSKDCGKPYYVSKKINGKGVYLGPFATIEDAVVFVSTLPTDPHIILKKIEAHCARRNFLLQRRNGEIMNLYKEGLRIKEIAYIYNMSSHRIAQIVNGYTPTKKQ